MKVSLAVLILASAVSAIPLKPVDSVQHKSVLTSAQSIPSSSLAVLGTNADIKLFKRASEPSTPEWIRNMQKHAAKREAIQSMINTAINLSKTPYKLHELMTYIEDTATDTLEKSLPPTDSEAFLDDSPLDFPLELLSDVEEDSDDENDIPDLETSLDVNELSMY